MVLLAPSPSLALQISPDLVSLVLIGAGVQQDKLGNSALVGHQSLIIFGNSADIGLAIFVVIVRDLPLAAVSRGLLDGL